MAWQRPYDHVILVGMMGSGKSTAARQLAGRLKRPLSDTDERIEERFRQRIADIFADHGERIFREAERECVAEALAATTPSVVALGGGAVLDGASRALMQRAGQVLFLRARPTTLAGRLGDGRGRPLLDGDVNGALERLDAARRPLYEEVADAIVDVDGRELAEVVAALADALVRRVSFPLGERSYDVLVGPGARRHLSELVPPTARRAVIVSQAGIEVELDAGVEATRIEIGPGEQAKSFTTVEMLCETFAEQGLTRRDVVIGLGGGVVTDVAGFAASCYHRGTPVVHVATSLLGQVDAALGGKTGVNLRHGKNLAGAFWQPSGVICDTDVLSGLPEREWRSGLGEMAKYAFLGVEDLDALPLTEQVARCVAVKAPVVAADEREGGGRALLNYGHTLAHALESIALGRHGNDAGLELRHGEAVALGLVFAARLARVLGRIDTARVTRHQEVVRAYGLPETLPDGLVAATLLEQMRRDKKALSGLTFVLDGPNGLEVVEHVPVASVLEALEESGVAGVLDPARAERATAAPR